MGWNCRLTILQYEWLLWCCRWGIFIWGSTLPGAETRDPLWTKAVLTSANPHRIFIRESDFRIFMRERDILFCEKIESFRTSSRSARSPAKAWYSSMTPSHHSGSAHAIMSVVLWVRQGGRMRRGRCLLTLSRRFSCMVHRLGRHHTHKSHCG
jgi:hypothetical protein